MKRIFQKIIEEIVIFTKGIIIAFSMYSKIPMPQLTWKEENMKYAICHFPMVGVIIGVVFYFWNNFCLEKGVPEITRICFSIVISIIITGGIHIDGFMDTSDALCSYQSKERKLEILKDSHIGAFCVIMLVSYILAQIGAIAILHNNQSIALVSVCFLLSRILSGISVVTFPCAKKEGTLYQFSTKAHKNFVRIYLLLELLVCSIAMVLINYQISCVIILFNFILFIYYFKMSKSKFGGITGDLAGWFLCLSELLSCFSIACLNYC